MNMKKILTAAILFLAAASVLDAKEITGRVHHNKKGIANVVVSDGKNFTLTDKDGNFTINTHKDARHVFIVTPSGYVTSCDSGTPHFYRGVDEKDFNFELFRWGIPGGRYTLFAVADPQPRGEAAFERLEKEAFSELKEYGNRIMASPADWDNYFYTKNGAPVLSLFLGDILWDNLDQYPRMKQMIKEIGHPVYPVIGNHDHDYKVADDIASAHIYEQFFGPSNYAFNAGNDYFIVLDNILYEGNKKYKEGVSKEQIKWVKEYLKYVPEGSHIYLAMHAQIHYYRGNYNMVNSDALLDAFNGYEVTVLTGHSHIQGNFQLRENIREYNIASIGGAWWLWDCKTSRDGTPLGYQVFEYDGNKRVNYYKSIGHDKIFQAKVFRPGTVYGYPDDLILKIWNWDSRWQVRARQCFKNGNKYVWEDVEVVQTSMADPDYSSYLQKEYIFNKGKEGKGTKPVDNVYFFFKVKPAPDATAVEFKVIDPYGTSIEPYVPLKLKY